MDNMICFKQNFTINDVTNFREIGIKKGLTNAKVQVLIKKYKMHP